jgi:hypothetical protein
MIWTMFVAAAMIKNDNNPVAAFTSKERPFKSGEISLSINNRIDYLVIYVDGNPHKFKIEEVQKAAVEELKRQGIKEVTE